MSTSIIDVFTSLNLTPTYLLVIGALVGYFRHQHEGKKVPGSLSIPKDLLKSTDFNKLWTLLYVLLLPLSWLVNVFAHAVYALMWLVNSIGIIVRWAANKLHWLWNQIVIGLGGFSFYLLWHYLVKWPYQLFSKMLSTFFGSFDWAAFKSTYRTAVIASLVGVSGFLIDDILDLEMFQFSDVSIWIGAMVLLNAVGSHMSAAMGAKEKGMRPTYAALLITAVLVFVAQTIAQDYLMLNEAAGILGGVVLGVSVVTWVYSILISAALVQFLSLLVPAYLTTEGPFKWLEALRVSFASRWLKSIGSIALFVIAYNTLGLWIYENVKQVAAEPYNEYVTVVDEKMASNESDMVEAQADLMAAISAEEASAEDLASAYSKVRAIESGNSFWSAVPRELRDVVYMDVNKPFSTEESDVEAAQGAVADFDSLAAFKVSEFDAAIEQALLDVSIAEAERNRIASSGITASEDGRLENGERMRFGMPIPEDADNLKWRITDDEGDTISRRTGSTLRYRFSSGSYEVHAAPINGCGTGQWSSFSVGVNESPESPLRIGAPKGRREVCVGDEHTYTVQGGMDIYVWNVPSGAVIVEEKDNRATVNWGSTSGDVSVYGVLDGEQSNTANLYVSVSGVPGASLSDAGSAGNDSPEEVENVQDNYSVLAEEADAKVDAAQAALASLEEDKAAYEVYAANESTRLNAKMIDVEKRYSSNTTQMIMNWLGKALFLFVACLLLAIALNFVVLWTSRYFGVLYNHDQDGPTYFRSSLGDYQSNYDGFPYLGLFVLVVIIVGGGLLGMAATQDLSQTLQEGDFPTLYELIRR